MLILGVSENSLSSEVEQEPRNRNRTMMNIWTHVNNMGLMLGVLDPQSVSVAFLVSDPVATVILRHCVKVKLNTHKKNLLYRSGTALCVVEL